MAFRHHGKLKDVDRYDLNLYFSNIGGYGVRLDNKLIYRGDMEPNLGYQGRLRKDNIRGSFIDLWLLYEDSWQELSRHGGTAARPGPPGHQMGGWRRLGIHAICGTTGACPANSQLGDYWVGHAIPLNKQRSTEQSARPMLVPAVRFRKIDYLEAPDATADTNAAYLDTRDYLVG